MACQLALDFDRLLHVPLTASLQVPLQLPLHMPLHVFLRFFLSLRFLHRFSNADSLGAAGFEIDSAGLEVGTSGIFNARIPFLKSSSVVTPSRCNCNKYSIFELIVFFIKYFLFKRK